MNRPDPVMRHLVAAMLYTWSLVAVNIAWHSTALAAWLIAVGVCYLAAIATFQALQASWRAWRWHKVSPPPAATAPLWPTSTAGEKHAAAMAALAADVPLPERMAAAGTERPLPATVPMPTVDVTAVLPVQVPYAVRYEFDPAGARTVVPERAGRAA